MQFDLPKKIGNANPSVWDKMEVLGRQIYLCYSPQKMWNSIKSPALYASKLKMADGSDKEFKNKPKTTALGRFWVEQMCSSGTPSSTKREKITTPKKRKMFESSSKSSEEEQPTRVVQKKEEGLETCRPPLSTKILERERVGHKSHK